jgi:DNA polymerase-4
MPLRTLAVDFNSFFASCEQQENPKLRGKPIGVVPVMADSSCCIAASYSAKSKGVKTGTRVTDAKLLCPGIELVEARPSLYISYHRRLLEIIESCIHVTEIRSIDEVECDLTGTFAPREKALVVARQIKAKVHKQVGPCMTSSIGIAPNWLLAKMATDMQKPDGLVVLEDEDIPQKLLGLELTDFLGIGERMDERLRQRGISTVEGLYKATRNELRGVWGGVEGERMYGRLRGENIPTPCEKNKTIGHSHVLPPMFRSESKSHAVLHRLLQKAAMRLRSIGHYAGALSVYVTYRNDKKWSDEIVFNETQDTLKLTEAFMLLWQRRHSCLKTMVPVQVGVVLSRLLPMRGCTLDLFNHKQQEDRDRLLHAMDTLNQTFGNSSVYFGGAFGVTDNAPMRISFTRIPEPEIEQIDPNRKRRLRPKVENPSESESEQ